MEIVIESDPYHRPSSTSPAPYLRSPNQAQSPQQQQQPQQQQALVNTSSAFYYATLPRGPRLTNGGGGGGTGGGGGGSEMPDGIPVSTSMRRIDKSGLLEIADLEPQSTGRQSTSRLLTGAESALTRRMLEAVPEIPDPPRLASDELLAAAATARSMVERQQHLLGAENELAALLRRRSYATSESQDSTLGKQSDSSEGSSVRRVKFADDPLTTTVLSPPIEDAQQHQQQTPQQQQQQQPKKNSVVDCLGRLSPRRVPPSTLSNIPDVIETATTTTTTAGSTGAPEGERAEAEGCEHTSVEEPPYKGSDSKVADNIQAVHVIILSEQL